MSPPPAEDFTLVIVIEAHLSICSGGQWQAAHEENWCSLPTVARRGFVAADHPQIPIELRRMGFFGLRDGIAKLCFTPDTADVPLHTHEQSERF